MGNRNYLIVVCNFVVIDNQNIKFHQSENVQIITFVVLTSINFNSKITYHL